MPAKVEWQRRYKKAVFQREEFKWKDGLSHKSDCVLFGKLQTELKVNRLYQVIKRNRKYQYYIMHLVRCLSIPDNAELLACNLCQATSYNIIEHYLIYCTSVNDLRNKMWDDISDALDVVHSVQLFSRDDVQILHVLLGGDWGESPPPVTSWDKIICTVAKHFNLMFKCCVAT